LGSPCLILSGRRDAGKLPMVRVPYQKLVRDRIPEIVQCRGAQPVTRVLDKESYRQALLAKLLEEAHEALAARPAELPGELADVLDVVRALAAVHGLTWDQLLDIAAAKRITNGAFRQRRSLGYIDQPDPAPPGPVPPPASP
jgi:predicted house-cleaning noncanonical NTP pyrophosphatase (MazG superfamily)